MPRRPLPEPIHCPNCKKVTNGAGYLGPMCQCNRRPDVSPGKGHGAGIGGPQ